MTCNICSSNEIIRVKVGSVILLHCLECDIYYNEYIPEATALNKYYENDYKITNDSFIETEKRRLSRIPEQISLISDILNYKDNNASILDIGCDKGFFLDEARRYGFSVTGIEPSNSASQYCDNIGIEVFNGLEELSSKHKMYDVAVIWHSLEHHSSPLESLTKLHQLLTSDGMLFIRVPAFNNIWSKILRDNWIWFQPDNHYYHFTTKSLKFLLTKSGFKIINIQKRRPNTRFTKKMRIAANLTFSKTFNSLNSMKQRLSGIYQDLTGIEIYAVAKKIKGSK